MCLCELKLPCANWMLQQRRENKTEFEADLKEQDSGFKHLSPDADAVRH